MMYTYKIMEYLGQYVRGIPHPAWIEAAMMGASALANMYSQSSTNRKMLDNASELLSRQQSFQREMNRDMYSTYRHSLEGAGMNLNSQLGGYPNTSSPTATPPALTAPQMDLSSTASLLQQQPLIDAQVKNIEADTNKKTVETENVSVDTLLKQTQNWALRQKTPAEVKNLEKNTEYLQEEMNRVKWDEKQIEANIELIKSKQSNIDVDTSFLLDSYDTRLGQLTATVSELQSRNALNIANAAVAYKSIEVMSHQIKEIESRVSLNQKEWLYLDTQITNLCIDGDFKQFQYNIEKKFGPAKAKLINDEINQNILNTRSSMMWRPVGMMIGAVGATAGVASVLK